MALFGYQLLTTIIVGTFLLKLSPIISLADYICSKLNFYFLAIKKDQDIKKCRKTDLFLQELLLEKTDLEAIKYYDQFRQLVDYACASIAVFVCNSLYWVFYPLSAEKEFNFVLCWIGIVIILWSALSFRVTKLYFSRASFQSEGRLCIVSSVACVVITSFLLYLGEGYFHHSLTRTQVSMQHGYLSPALVSVLVYGVLIVSSAVIGGVLTFPGFRLAQEHRQILHQKDLPLRTKFLCYVHFYLPHAIAVSCFKPGVHYVAYDLFELTTPEQDLPQLTCVLTALYIALCTFMASSLLQAYLNKGSVLFHDHLHTKNDSKEDLSNMVTAIPQYFGVVLSQLALPVVLILCLAVLSVCTRPYLCCFSYVRTAPAEQDVLLGDIFSYLWMFSVFVLAVSSSLGAVYYSNSRHG